MEEELDLPYPFAQVWQAALSTIRSAGWNIVRKDPELGRIEMHVVMDMITWVEVFYLNFVKTGETITRVVMGRAGLAQPLDWGIARQYMENFLLKLKSNLSNSR